MERSALLWPVGWGQVKILQIRKVNAQTHLIDMFVLTKTLSFLICIITEAEEVSKTEINVILIRLSDKETVAQRWLITVCVCVSYFHMQNVSMDNKWWDSIIISSSSSTSQGVSLHNKCAFEHKQVVKVTVDACVSGNWGDEKKPKSDWQDGNEWKQKRKRRWHGLRWQQPQRGGGGGRAWWGCGWWDISLEHERADILIESIIHAK